MFAMEEEGEGGEEVGRYKKIEIKCYPTPCNIFYQKKEFMNINNFYELKKLEWQAHREHEAAIKIQSFFRSWLIQKNLKLLNDAATKIQSLIRRFLAHKRVEKLKKELEERKLVEKRNKAATTIQRYWRGYYSRKNCFDYYKYKHVQNKNAELARSISAINQIESLATSSTNLIRSRNEMNEILNKLTSFDNLDELLKLSPSRICQLQDYIDKMNQDCFKKGGRPGPKNLKLAQKLKEECQKRTKVDSLDRLFPEMPDIEGIIKPDEEKAAKLKKAIRKLRDQIEINNQNLLAKKHHLLRTYQQPGILSDICGHELTPMEKQLKALKFYGRPKIPKCQDSMEMEKLFETKKEPNEFEQIFKKKLKWGICEQESDSEEEESSQQYNPWA